VLEGPAPPEEYAVFALLAQAAESSSPFGGQFGMLPLVVIFFAIFYFMIIRPQQKQQKDHKSWVDQLKKGDEVVTGGGVIGKVSVVAGDIVTLEVANNVKLRVMKAQITGPFAVPVAPPAPAQAKTDEKAAASPAEEPSKK
jgi:preprotein translocase subunit YajC